jgi:hypothetical protein
MPLVSSLSDTDTDTDTPGRSAAPLGLVAGFADRFDASALDVARQIDATGVACLSGVVSDEWLADARAGIAAYFSRCSAHELLVERVATGEGTSFADRLVGDSRLRPLLQSVLSAAGMRGRADAGFQVDLRLVNGPGPAHKPPGFHYDGSVVTMVIPIAMPDAEPGRRGELILCPNRRPYRRSVVTNVLEKFVTQNDLSRRRFVRRAPGSPRLEVVDLKPGNAYLFWGYRSYHATLPCRPGDSRATLIIHYGNLHRDSALLMGSMALGRKLRGLCRTVSSGAGSYQVVVGAP